MIHSERAEQDTARRYARHLLTSLGFADAQASPAHEHPALAWKGSGVMALSGAADAPPQMCPAPLAACADGVLAALAALAPDSPLQALRGSQLLAERAGIAGYSRAGSISPGGSCRLLRAQDGWLALNLARDEDWQLLDAWLRSEIEPQWPAVEVTITQHCVTELVAQGRDLGLALAAVNPQQDLLLRSPDGAQRNPGWAIVGEAAPRISLRSIRATKPAPLVIDLSSLWAGPLCGHLLQQLGARVIKVESTQRPDGARFGPAAFFDLLNAGKECVALDLQSAEGRAQLRALIDCADIVIEGSRPRALRQLGIDAEALLRERPRLTWIAISGYGRGEPQENWIAYGDDAAVAAGLSQLQFEATGERMMVGDAIADPLTGLHAALTGWATHLRGGGLVSMSLCEVVRGCLAFERPSSVEALRRRQQDWTHVAARSGEPAAPKARTAAGSARLVGGDTRKVLREFGIPC